MNYFFKSVSALLSYPSPTLMQAIGEIRQAKIAMPLDERKALARFLNAKEPQSLSQWQEEYVAIFDRGLVPLNLFHFVHGESKDRGQAMVSLLARYREHGLIFKATDLPDALPIYLEFVALLPPSERSAALADIGHLLVLMAKALHDLGSAYFYLLAPLVDLAGLAVALPEEPFTIKSVVDLSTEKAESLDRQWAEVPAFANQEQATCASVSMAEQPIQWAKPIPAPAVAAIPH